MLSQTEENYIKTIFNLSPSGKRVSTNQIADTLDTKPSSVTDMIQRLSEKKLVHYVKYQGVSLTSSGLERAVAIIRNSRLWEVFLVDKLGYSWDEVHAIAEQLEHVRSETLIDRLDRFLNFPEIDPHGDPIPNKKGEMAPRKSHLLSSVLPGEECSIVGVKDSSSDFLKYLDRLKIKLGTLLKVIRVEKYDQSITLESSGESLVISHQTAQNLFIKKYMSC
jgi:DtxR family Mn-dependent transcriptional regulator